MMIPCPFCGNRDLREFSVRGSAVGLNRPEGEVWSEAWHDFVHLRENPAGRSEELWHHSGGCGAWLVVERDTTNHDIISVRHVSEGRT